MLRTGTVKYIKPVFTAVFYIAIFLFFAVLYNNHLHFLEQSQCFILTREYLLTGISLPGGLAGYTGEFLTQFYFSSMAGPAIITFLLFLIQFFSRIIIAQVNPNKNLFTLSFLPAVLCAALLCDEYYPLSGTVGFLSALIAGLLYIIIKRKRSRFIAGLLIIPVVYWIAGGSYFVLSTIIILYEVLALSRSERARPGISPLKSWQLVVFVIISIIFPLIIRQIIFQPLNLSYISEFYYDLRTVIPAGIIILFALLPVIMIIAFYLGGDEQKTNIMAYLMTAVVIVAGYAGFKSNTNFEAENIYKYDNLALNGRWKEIISFAEKHPPRNDLSLSMLNLALAKTGRMGYEMFRYEQNGDEGLFLPSSTFYFPMIQRSEIFFHLGLLNASQESAFESMETTPNLKKPVRAIKRLAEVNLLNGHYEVAGKYIKILRHTLFYKKWAIETEKYLYNEDMADKNQEWSDIRKVRLHSDYFFKSGNINSIIDMLKYSLVEDPAKPVVFEYLMAHYLLNKDLLNIPGVMALTDKINYKEIPLNYQEALLYTTNLTPDGGKPEIQNKISEFTRKRMKEYLYTFSTKRNPNEDTMKKFRGTYWYYFDFKDIKISN